MKVVLITEPKQLEIVEQEMPELRPDEVLVRSRVVSLETRDADIYRGNAQRGTQEMFPVVPGYAWSGEIVRVGANVPAHLAGKRVCIENDTHDEVSGGVMGRSATGGLAEYVAVSLDALHLVPDTMSFEDAAMLGMVADVTQAFLRGLDAVQVSSLMAARTNGSVAPTLPTTQADKSGTSTIAIVGDDVVALCALQVAHALYLSAFLVIIGFQEQRLQLGKSLGATHTINIGREDAQALVRALSRGKGADISFEGTGDAQAAVEAMLLTRHGGTVLLMGTAGANALLSVEGDLFVRNNLSIYGSAGASHTAWTLAERLYTTDHLQLTPLVSHRFPLDDVQDAFDELVGQTGKTMKVLVQV